MSTYARRLVFGCVVAVALCVGSGHAADEAESGAPAGDSGFTLIDTHNVRVVVKNVRQEDDSGDSNTGIGLDWQYAFEKQFPKLDGGVPKAFERCDNATWATDFLLDLSASGKGFTSLNDSKTGPDEAKDASNFNSITNRFRYAGFLRAIPPCERVEPPPTDPTKLKEWKERNRGAIRKRVERDAEGYVAADFGFHAETESNQTFNDTQVALGGSVTVASGLVAQYLLYPLKFLVPDRDEYSDVVQSPQLFLGVEEVVAASHRKQIDNVADADFTRFRLELGWTTELLVSGLYPFVRYHHYEELSAPAGIRQVSKDSTNFYELGFNYYVGDRFDAVRKAFGEHKEEIGELVEKATGMSGIFKQGGGPFVTIRYAAGELPPYLESDHQASVGLGITF